MNRWREAWMKLRGGASTAAVEAAGTLRRRARGLLWLAGTVVLLAALVHSPPLVTVAPGHAGLRVNQLSGEVSVWSAGAVPMLPVLFRLREVSLLDQVYHAGSADKPLFQSSDGLGLGADVVVRYALDPQRLARQAATLDAHGGAPPIEAPVQGVVYRVLARYTMREIYALKRSEVLRAVEAELRPQLAAEGVLLRGVTMGRILPPAEYRAGMERLMAEELAAEKMRFTLELKEKQVLQTGLEADADKLRREKEAEAAGAEQIIAARAQEQAMAHVLPFKEKQIEQRRLEAEADKAAHIKTSEGNAEARLIEAAGEADSRRKLADAEAYRQELLGKTTTAQMARDGALLTRHPLLVQKAMADKLSDKISVIIAPPPTDGGFLGAALLGQGKGAPASDAGGAAGPATAARNAPAAAAQGGAADADSPEDGPAASTPTGQ